VGSHSPLVITPTGAGIRVPFRRHGSGAAVGKSGTFQRLFYGPNLRGRRDRKVPKCLQTSPGSSGILSVAVAAAGWPGKIQRMTGSPGAGGPAPAAAESPMHKKNREVCPGFK